MSNISIEGKCSEERWSEFCLHRASYVSTLAETVAQGVTRQDTDHPAFCGCIDWHSSVHGTYALLVAARLTGEQQWRDVAESILTSQSLTKELSCLTLGELDHELPYGYAWFLKLAQEREQSCGKTDLLPLATEMATRLTQWLFSLSEEEVLHHAQRREYGNLSWAVLNLWEWSQWKQDVELSKKLSTFISERVLSRDQEILPGYDDCTDEFFAASLQRTRTILSILSQKESEVWIKSYYKQERYYKPLKAALKPHSAGLNFSRSWGLWSLYKVSGNQVYRDMYVDHIVTHMDQPQYWRDHYKKYSHWVPQFGIYAIALSMDDVEVG